LNLESYSEIRSEKIRNILDSVLKKLSEYERSKSYHLRDVLDEGLLERTPKKFKVRPELFRSPGVYVISENDAPIYVGMTGKNKRTLNDRINDLFFYCPNNPKVTNRYHHMITGKLLLKENRFNNIAEVTNFYLSSCSLKVVQTETFAQARTIESILIELLQPRYND
jgi:hypothetical protein